MDPLVLVSSKLAENFYEQILEVWRKYQSKREEERIVNNIAPSPLDETLEFETVIGRFVTCNIGFQAELKSLKEAVEGYSSRKKPKRPLNIMLAATPGSGKSFLVKELSKNIAAETEFIEYHVASLRSVDELFSILQKSNTPV